MADNDKVPDGRMEPRCAAWQTWQVVSCCPFWWVWVAVWVRNTTNSTARVKVNTLVQFPMVFPLKAINHFNTASDWTRRPNHSKRQLNPAQRSGTYLTCSMSCSGRAAYAIIADDRNHGCAGSHSRRAVARKSEIFCRSFSTMPAVTSCSTEIPSA